LTIRLDIGLNTAQKLRRRCIDTGMEKFSYLLNIFQKTFFPSKRLLRSSLSPFYFPLSHLMYLSFPLLLFLSLPIPLTHLLYPSLPLSFSTTHSSYVYISLSPFYFPLSPLFLSHLLISSISLSLSFCFPLSPLFLYHPLILSISLSLSF
jgi:hypothetical protein